MSGHSHAKTVMATKMANAAKKGKIYSKYGRLITIAVKDGGGSGDPTKNSKLKATIEQAKAMDMPKENIERAIKKGTGELAGEALEEVSYEGFGPGGIALIINGITDNANRTLSEIKSILNQNNGKMAGEGAVRWMFERKGVIIINLQKTEELEMTVIEAGADDIKSYDNQTEIYTKTEDLDAVKKALEDKGLKIESASLDMIAKEEVEISEKEKEQVERLFEALDDNEAVNNIYSNLKS
ncbi:MAG: transcriptional regulator [Candidatus Staskawiczbacteria bacterium RIFOXYD2_FULL_37_9]|uniref:Probable transcriptional regulatory protein A2358_02680 n=1 Tax=Candidatus Staskawiczbacteria bacterium RIFOXYB1_FULL_37_44 TaxID=1802223 RepID=A0A1G2IUL9_9BACT|nr:MAG: transcriptional regulator [Candidatus Staskawiczbacteria bacterium RIFOXYB1_FULL_37_44]OGZ84404.1 MAG: transcriptional regulator [Candidatus Staskawiczbacteria bacterium RIFOXYC1_FULL_37_52]OGZ88160.1 MAG: transcriptional regulator [Candidatus Staskawiczbacteria bacterium RIFOXYC2_FULL_37_19]OGZ89828.1 MAG: transcriptional regulator [Candidatus Staskawiczbacteria bacterium RIFOXYD1_FULL_37_110]OGZ94559.1 MAG: transcriptional regulator [Candidatus Staskawiczbacteria bacterium RIFOXYD2_FU